MNIQKQVMVLSWSEEEHLLINFHYAPLLRFSAMVPIFSSVLCCFVLFYFTFFFQQMKK